MDSSRLSRLKTYLLAPSGQDSHEVNVMALLLRQRFAPTMAYMKNEFGISLLINLAYSLLMLLVVLQQPKSLYLCQPLRFAWISAVCLLNCLSMFPKVLMHVLLRSYESTPATLESLVLELYSSRLYQLHKNISMWLIMLYLSFMVTLNVSKFSNSYLLDLGPYTSNMTSCAATAPPYGLSADSISLLLLSVFFLRVFHSFLAYRRLYNSALNPSVSRLSRA